MKEKIGKKFTIRARCGADTKMMLTLAASTLGLDCSDVIRLAIKHYAASVLAQPAAILNGAR